MARSDYQSRNEAAIERGYDSLYDQTVSRREAREFLEDHGLLENRQQVWDLADFNHAFGEGEYSRDELRDWYDENIGGDENDFYEWLAELYNED